MAGGADFGDDDDGIVGINVTPLVDVMLVLLVVFMIASFAITTGISMPLPESSTSYEKQDKGDHVVVSIDAEGKVFVGKDATAHERLIDDVNAVAKTPLQTTSDVVVPSDRALGV